MAVVELPFTLQEKVSQLVVDAPAIDRVGVPAYHWRSNVLHGLVDNGVSTMFPQATGLAATFDPAALHAAAAACGSRGHFPMIVKMQLGQILHSALNHHH